MEDKKILKDELLDKVTGGVLPGPEAFSPAVQGKEPADWDREYALPTEAGNYKLPIDIEPVPLYPEYEKKD